MTSFSLHARLSQIKALEKGRWKGGWHYVWPMGNYCQWSWATRECMKRGKRHRYISVLIGNSALKVSLVAIAIMKDLRARGKHEREEWGTSNTASGTQ